MPSSPERSSPSLQQKRGPQRTLLSTSPRSGCTYTGWMQTGVHRHTAKLLSSSQGPSLLSKQQPARAQRPAHASVHGFGSRALCFRTLLKAPIPGPVSPLPADSPAGPSPRSGGPAVPRRTASGRRAALGGSQRAPQTRSVPEAAAERWEGTDASSAPTSAEPPGNLRAQNSR